MQKQILFLTFDHRNSFKRDLLGIEGRPNKNQVKKVKQLKNIVFRGFLEVFKKYPSTKGLGILVDEQFGKEIIKKAKTLDVPLALPTEKSGQAEFQFEYGNQFGSHIKKTKPDYVKALVRYNPLNKETNKKQLTRLKKLSSFCHQNKYQLILELLVPPTREDLKTSGSLRNYDQKLRLTRTLQAVLELRCLKPNIWKMEGFTTSGWAKIVKVINKGSKIIVLGRGGNKAHVIAWLKAAKKYQQIIGFAIGRTIFAKALKKYVAKQITQQQAVLEIAKNYQRFVDYWQKS